MPVPQLQTVSELSRQLKTVVEAQFARVLVQGELSNVSRAASGHVYLTLKDDAAQLRAVIWRSTARRLRFDLQDGLEVVAAGRLEVYEPRGTYQLVVDQLEPKGLGALELAFRQLQEKLAAEGLFDPARKRPLPRFPRGIALVTSPSGAAVRDLLQVISRRWRPVRIVIVPVPVQGASAAPLIAQALRDVGRIPEVDVVITGRGGGSLEDLWAFNEEVVARAIASCPLPVVSAVGHEIDVSIADLVADCRALTPSEAAELVVPSAQEVRATLDHCRRHLEAALKQRLERARISLDALRGRPVLAHPLALVRDRETQLDEMHDRISRAMMQLLGAKRRTLQTAAASLDALNPLQVLARGYAIAQRLPTRSVIRSIEDVQAADRLEVVVPDGAIACRVETTRPRPLETDADVNAECAESDGGDP